MWSIVFCLNFEQGAMYIPPTKIFLTVLISLTFGVKMTQTASIPSGTSTWASSTGKFSSLYSIATPPPVTETEGIPFPPMVGIPLTPLLDSFTLYYVNLKNSQTSVSYPNVHSES